MVVSSARVKFGVLILGALGIALFVIGITALTLLPSIFKRKLEENLRIEEGKETYKKWKQTPIPITFKIYLFNVTNPYEVIQGAKPVVKEVGPYVFKQYRSKDVLSWDPTEFSVTYRGLKQYHFVEERSADMSNKIYSLNLPLQGIIKFIKKLSYWTKMLAVPALESILKGYAENVFSHRTAQELLFVGYKVDLIQDLVDRASNFVTVPEILPNNTFGFMYGKNNSNDGVFTVYTGFDDIAKYAQIVRWNNMTRIPFWKSDYCNMMNGTDGAQFHPHVTRKDILYAYSPELCRSVYLRYAEDVTVQGIPAFRFKTSERVAAPPSVNPDNMCFCVQPEHCEYTGVLDISACKKGLKLAWSSPHFYRTHQHIKEQVDGLHPIKEKHESYVDVEPTTGMVLRASRKLQLNFILDKFEEMEDFKDLPFCYLPLFWVLEEAEIDRENAAKFTSKVKTPITIAKSVLTACIVLGLLWIAIAGITIIYILMKERKTSKGVTKKSEEKIKS